MEGAMNNQINLEKNTEHPFFSFSNPTTNLYYGTDIGASNTTGSPR